MTGSPAGQADGIDSRCAGQCLNAMLSSRQPLDCSDPPVPLRMAWIVAWLVGVAIVLPVEVSRCFSLWSSSGNPAMVLFHWNADTTPYVPLLIAWPFLMRRVGWAHREQSPASLSGQLLVGATQPTQVIVIAILTFAVSLGVGLRFGDLPPAYHDEYSYLFQSQTFLTGRTWFPSFVEPRLFDQMHVLNEGRFASRYFPGAGLWLAPFVALGHPHLGFWLANAIAAALVSLIGQALAGPRAGLIAGLLVALSPGLALFSNLLLAHHPTLVGLLLFVWAFLRMLQSPRTGWAALAGAGLTFAMLCRPMTAAGVALPFGVYFVGWLVRGVAGAGAQRSPGSDKPEASDLGMTPKRAASATVLCAALAAPLVAGVVGLGWYNRQISSSVWTSPYQQYTDLYTPRHVYGFNNGVRGERNLGPRVIEHYDRWAENLTPTLAARNVCDRLIASGQWTLGLVPLAMVAALLLVGWRPLLGGLPPSARTGVALLLAGIASLHLVHIPYWFVGIMNWHYVFESAALWLVVVGLVSSQLFDACRSRAWRIWWGLVLAVPVAMNLATLETVWEGRLWTGVREVRFARMRHAQFRAVIERAVTERPAIVLVRPDPADRHIDFVTNHPSLSSDVLIGRELPDVPVEQVRTLFPGRTIYHFDARTFGVRR